MNKKHLFAILMATLVPALASAAPITPRTTNRATRNTPAAAAEPVPEPRVSGIPEEGANTQTSDIYIPAGTELDIALKIYGQLIGKTVLRDPSVPDAKITLVSGPGQQLTREDQIEALEAVFEMNGIHFEAYGSGVGDDRKFVRAMPREKARDEATPVILDEDADVPESMKVFSVMIPFKNIPIDEAKTVLEGLKSPKGKLNVYERIGKILVTDTGLNILSMRKIAREIDVATPVNENVFVRQITNASAADIKDKIKEIVDESSKEMEKESKALQQGQTTRSGIQVSANTPTGTLRRPGLSNANNNNAQASAIESLVASVSDADRGMIRGKVLISADERSNKLIIITSEANMKFFDKMIQELDVTTTPEVEVKVIRLKYADAEDVADMINDLIGNSSNSKSSQKNNTNQNAKNSSNQGGNLTRNTSGTTTQNRSNTASTSANQRSGESKAGELSKDNVVVLADERINGLVVMAHKDVWPTVLGIIEKMDVKLSQVLIETAIVEVTLGDELSTGVDWVQRGREKTSTTTTSSVQSTDANGNSLYTYTSDGTTRQAYQTTDASGNTVYADSETGTIIDSTTTALSPLLTTVTSTITGLTRDTFVNNGSYALGGGGGTGSDLLNTMMGVSTNAVTGTLFNGVSPTGSGVNYLLKSDKLNIAAVIQASQVDSRTKYIASPIVMTVDNKEATIEATQMRYLLKGYTYSGSTYNGTTVPDYEQKEIGLTIKVTPKINPNGTVMLTVEQEYSQVGANQSIQANVGGDTVSTVSVPTTITRKMSADISLDNMQTVVLGGLTETTISESETGIPLLMDIPYIGKWLFASTSYEESRKELLVFMTPYVLNDSESAQAEAARRKRALSDVRAWENNGWSESELADPMRKKELLRRLKEEAEKRDEERSNRLAVEKWKLDRAKELEKMSESERKFWIEQAREELKDDNAKKEFDKHVEGYSQEDLKELAARIRAEQVEKAEDTITKAKKAEKTTEQELNEAVQETAK